MENKGRRSKTKKKNRIGFVGFLVLAFVLIVCINVAFTYKDRLTTTIVRHGAEEDMFSAEGYIFREQTIINAPESGYIYCVADEDERVGIGETVMYIYKNSINASANSRIKEIEEKITKLSATALTGDVFSNDSTKIEQTILQSLKSIGKFGYENNIKAVSEVSENVNSLIEKRRIISGELKKTDHSDEIKKLEAEKAQIEKEYNIERTIVHAPKTGAFTARVDGLEEKLALGKLAEVNGDYIKELSKAQVNAKTPESVNKGDAIGKIVNNFNWSIAARVKKDDVEGLQAGNEISIRFPDIGVETIRGTVTRLSEEGSDKVIITVKSNQYIEGIYSLSKAKVEFVKNSYDGYRIPAKSLRMIDGKMGVYVIRNGKAKFLPITLLYSGKGSIVVSEKAADTSDGSSALKLYDELIVEGKNIYDGKAVR